MLLADVPSNRLTAGAQRYVELAADVLATCETPFVLGLFGPWGAGKTSILRGVEERLRLSNRAFPVMFNAWRYEREDHLLVPLLDTLKDALTSWHASVTAQDDRAEAVRSAIRAGARSLALAGRALLAGFAVRVGVSDMLTVSYDANKSLVDLRKGLDAGGDEIDNVPASFFHAAIGTLREKFEEISNIAPNGRVVVLIDDLDRCLPQHAFEVLEASKVFLDLPGVAFGLGIDREVVAAVAEARYGVLSRENALTGERSAVKGAEYLQKVCSAWIDIEPIPFGAADDLIEAVIGDDHIPKQQARLVRTTVKAHLPYRFPFGRINPRAVKQFINDFTITMRLKPDLNPDVVLSLAILRARQDWAEAFSLIRTYGHQFLRQCAEMVETPPTASERSRAYAWDGKDHTRGIPTSFLAYVGAGPGAPLLDVQGDLPRYFFRTARLADHPDISEVDALFDGLAAVSQQINEWGGDASTDFKGALSDSVYALGNDIADALGGLETDSPWHGELSQADRLLTRLRDLLEAKDWEYGDEAAKLARETVEELRLLLVDVRRRSGLGAAPTG